MAWFKEQIKESKTSTADKKDAPDGLWVFKTPKWELYSY